MIPKAHIQHSVLQPVYIAQKGIKYLHSLTISAESLNLQNNLNKLNSIKLLLKLNCYGNIKTMSKRIKPRLKRKQLKFLKRHSQHITHVNSKILTTYPILKRNIFASPAYLFKGVFEYFLVRKKMPAIYSSPITNIKIGSLSNLNEW